MVLPVLAFNKDEVLVKPFPVFDHDVDLPGRSGVPDEGYIVLDFNGPRLVWFVSGRPVPS